MVQLQLSGERLQFRRLEGAGPDTGWVSLTLKAGSFEPFFFLVIFGLQLTGTNRMARTCQNSDLGSI